MYNKKEIIDFLKNDENNDYLFTLANNIRQEYVGEKVHLRALIEFSNVCKQNCAYCGIQSKNKSILRYRMSLDEIFNYAKNAIDIGYRTVVLQSGEDTSYDTKSICKLISDIKSLGCAITLSIGEKTYDEYKAYKDAGADRYLLRIETTDKELYSKLHPNMDWENRLNCLENLKTLGYEVGTGSLIGLPNQSIESMADDILFFDKIGADMIGVGPFISHPQTILKNAQNGSWLLALKVMAMSRILMKDINIPATTAMETLCKDARFKALNAGANVVMLNVVDDVFNKKYEIYPNKVSDIKDIKGARENIKTQLLKIGRTISDNCGFRGEL